MTRTQITYECPHCGAENDTDPIHPGEIKRSTNCTECGEWFTIYDEGV